MKHTTKRMAFIAIFAAVNFVVFTYGKIDIPLAAGGMIAIHVANAVVVLSGLLLGPLEGALAGAIGLSLADVLDPKYIIYAPMTFFLKFMIGYIAGTLAQRLNLPSQKDKKQIFKLSLICSVVALGINVIAYPLVKYFYFNVILQVGSDASAIFTAMVSGITLLDAVICVIVAVALYGALKKSFSSIYQ